jgi:hypothetical protein
MRSALYKSGHRSIIKSKKVKKDGMVMTTNEIYVWFLQTTGDKDEMNIVLSANTVMD